MPILSHIPIDITPEEAIAGFNGIKGNARLENEILEILPMANCLWEPKAAYEWLSIRKKDSERITVCSDHDDRKAVLTLGKGTRFLAHAESALAGMVTLGRGPDEAINERNRLGDTLQAYLLDHLAVLALGKLGQVLSELAETSAELNGWGISPILSPGSIDGWDVSDQPNLLALLPMARIGVRLNGGNMMQPLKSVSSVIGIGPGYDARHTGSQCRVCTRSETCHSAVNMCNRDI